MPIKEEKNNFSINNNDNHIIDQIQKDEIKLSEEQNDFSSNSLNLIFTTKKYEVENGKRKRVKKKRKYKPDDIRKKIKARFHKKLKDTINDYLKLAGSKKLFDFFPQCFIGNVSRETNSKYLNYTYKQMLLTNFSFEIKKEKSENMADFIKYNRNKDVVEYLDKNPEICRRSGFDLVRDKTYKELLEIYFSSNQFVKSLIQLKERENETYEYIQEYKRIAQNYVKFYSKDKLKEEPKLNE